MHHCHTSSARTRHLPTQKVKETYWLFGYKLVSDGHYDHNVQSFLPVVFRGPESCLIQFEPAKTSHLGHPYRDSLTSLTRSRPAGLSAGLSHGKLVNNGFSILSVWREADRRSTYPLSHDRAVSVTTS